MPPPREARAQNSIIEAPLAAVMANAAPVNRCMVTRSTPVAVFSAVDSGPTVETTDQDARGEDGAGPAVGAPRGQREQSYAHGERDECGQHERDDADLDGGPAEDGADQEAHLGSPACSPDSNVGGRRSHSADGSLTPQGAAPGWCRGLSR
jgi:hypothetical protein